MARNSAPIESQSIIGSETDESSCIDSSNRRDGQASSTDFATKENKHVRYSRILVVLVVVFSVLCLGHLTYNNTFDAELDAFEAQVRAIRSIYI